MINKKTKQKAARKKKSARLLDRISALVHSHDFQLLTKRQHKELTKLCAQTVSPGGSEVSQLQPKALLAEYVLPEKSKTDNTVSNAGLDSDSDLDATRPKFSARDSTLFAKIFFIYNSRFIINDLFC